MTDEKSTIETPVFGRDAILKEASLDFTPAKTFIPPLNAFVFFKKMNAMENCQYEWDQVNYIEKENGLVDIERNMAPQKLKYLVKVICDEDGVRLFEDEEWSVLGEKDPKIINALYTAALGATKEDNKSYKDSEKNLDSGEEESSISG
jgi:hypothetical protein